MRARPGRVAAAFVETFVLLAVCVGGTGLVLAASLGYASAIGGSSVSIGDGAIEQGGSAALLRLVVYNTGDASISSFTVSVQGASPLAHFCYSVTDPLTRTPLASTCPPTSVDPSTIAVPYGVSPGHGLLLEVTMAGEAFQTGSRSMVVVTTPGGAQAVDEMTVVQA